MSSAGPPPLAQADAVSSAYKMHRVLFDVKLCVGQGEMVGLVGPNGSGKTTLLHAITGYQPLTSGAARLDGTDVRQLSRREIAARVAFVPQRTESTFGFTALEMVMMGRHPFAGFSAYDSAADLELANGALVELGMEQFALKRFQAMSGGEQQLVLLARAFAQGSPLLILDEPLTGLDLGHQHKFMSSLDGRVRSGRNSVLATFHDLTIASRWCSRLILLNKGYVIAEGAPADVITPENLKTMYGVSAAVTPQAGGRGLSVHVLETSISGVL